MVSIKEILEQATLEKKLELLSLMKHEVAMEDLAIKDKFKKYKNIILNQSESIRFMIDNAIENNQYLNCRRGIFGAFVLDTNKDLNISGTHFNMPDPKLLEECKFSGSCIRELIDKKHGLSYDNCPATHARERLIIEFSKENSEKLIWVEGGAVLSDGKMKSWDINKYGAYTCIRCLNYSLLQGVRILAALGKSGFNENEWDVSFHSIENHAKYLLARNTVDQMN